MSVSDPDPKWIQIRIGSRSELDTDSNRSDFMFFVGVLGPRCDVFYQKFVFRFKNP
jgi:hypothetical protein